LSSALIELAMAKAEADAEAEAKKALQAKQATLPRKHDEVSGD
jgi:hypothetical protein